ncbi:MAG: hypothetical protein LH628_09600 [Microcoleus sp. CAN_BIN18]|nr:hypothetical protein [Microcoleus sp. CAN_BIN18]
MLIIDGERLLKVEGFRRKKEEGRRKKEEGRGKREEGRGNIFPSPALPISRTPHLPLFHSPA